MPKPKQPRDEYEVPPIDDVPADVWQALGRLEGKRQWREQMDDNRDADDRDH